MKKQSSGKSGSQIEECILFPGVIWGFLWEGFDCSWGQGKQLARIDAVPQSTTQVSHAQPRDLPLTTFNTLRFQNTYYNFSIKPT